MHIYFAKNTIFLTLHFPLISVFDFFIFVYEIFFSMYNHEKRDNYIVLGITISISDDRLPIVIMIYLTGFNSS